MRAAYFTVVPLYYTSSGGALCCQNHVRRLAQESDVDLSVFVCGPTQDASENQRTVESLGARFSFIPYRSTSERNGSLRRSVARRWPFLYEATALEQAHVDEEFANHVRRTEPNVVIVDYVPSASFVRSLYSTRMPRVTITLNREGDFYRELRTHGAVPPGASPSWIAARRARRFEHWVYARSDAVVALTPGDLPDGRGNPPLRSVMPAAFDPSPTRWVWRNTRSIVFVGAIGHYPNRLAIEWLLTRLVPELERLESDVEVRIIGATEDSVPSAWVRPGVVFLGTGGPELVADELSTAGLFVAPISNPFGSKIKLLDCLSHGTPFFATSEAMTGLPFISRAAGTIDLRDPGALAADIERVLGDRESVVASSARLAAELDSFLAGQRGRWSELLQRVVAASP